VDHPARFPEVTRLAPSPTGALHLGNARTFLVNWALARRRGWRIVLRIEDLDTPRIKPGVLDLTIDLLRWLGIDWDEGPYVQSADLSRYVHAMESLERAGLVYPCELTRTQIEAAASAPQEGSHELVFPASLRPVIKPWHFADQASSWRFLTPDVEVRFYDTFAGEQVWRPAQTIGDFVVWTRREPGKPGQPSYQLAVVVDDARQGVTQVVRGDDLVESAARQMLLYQALGFSPIPTYTHLPLVKGADGKRLAKRHGDTRLDTYRSKGVKPERVIGLIAHWCGLGPLREMSSSEFQSGVDLGRMSREPITFLPEHESWLFGRAG
jgi:glutamyl-tRNA synthetase